eukprot:jgi/Chlat1/6311/Chrsp44S09057
MALAQTLHELAAANDVTSILDVSNMVDMDAPDEYGRTALFAAAYNGAAEALQTLLQEPCLETLLQNGVSAQTGIAGAIAGGQTGILRLLISAGAALDADALQLACAQSQLECARMIVEEAGVDADAPAEGGRTALHTACYQGSLPLLSYLLSRGSSPSLRDSSGLSPLHFAAAGGQVGAIDALVIAVGAGGEKEGLMEARDEMGRTAVHVAASGGWEGVVKRMGELGADLDASDASGRTLLHAAVQSDRPACVSVVLAVAPQLLDRPDKEKRQTPLLAAAAGGYARSCAALCAGGANVAATDTDG